MNVAVVGFRVGPGAADEPTFGPPSLGPVTFAGSAVGAGAGAICVLVTVLVAAGLTAATDPGPAST